MADHYFASPESLNALKKRKIKFIALICGDFIVFGAFIAIAFTFQRRETQNIWIAALAILGTICCSLALFLFVKGYLPTKHYVAFLYKALSRERPIENGNVESIRDGYETFMGFETKVISVRMEDTGKLLSLHYESSDETLFEVGKRYEFEIDEDTIIRTKEIEDEA